MESLYRTRWIARSARLLCWSAAVAAALLACETAGVSYWRDDAVQLQPAFFRVPPQPFALAAPAGGQTQVQTPRIPVITDWTSRSVMFPEVAPRRVANIIQNDPRFAHHYLRRHLRDRFAALRLAQASMKKAVPVERDWHVDVFGNPGASAAPAKYQWDITKPPDCTNDYVAMGLNIAGSPTQANLVAYNNIYKSKNPTTGAVYGTCATPGDTGDPTILFSFNVHGGATSGAIINYITLSLDGRKIAFNEQLAANGTGYFHVFTWAKAGARPDAPATAGQGNTAVDVAIPIPSGTYTAPYVDYLNDVAYVTTSDNRVRKFRNVFNGTPTEVVGNGWPVSVNGTTLGDDNNPVISTPIFDPVTRHAFFTNAINSGSGITPGTVNYVDDSGTTAALVRGPQVASGMASAKPVLLDISNQKVYAFSDNQENAGNGNAQILQTNTNFTGTPVVVGIGPAAARAIAQAADANDAYFSGQSANARLYIVGNDTSNGNGDIPTLYEFRFNSSFTMNSSSSDSVALATGSAGASPLTSYYNPALSKQFIFVGVTANCGTPSGGCLRAIDVTGPSFPKRYTNLTVSLDAVGGTSAITIDSVSSGADGGASVYFESLLGHWLVKATQLGLN